MILHHVSPKKIEKIHSNGRWGSFLFFSEDGFVYCYGETYKYTIEVQEDEIVYSSDLFSFVESDSEEISELVQEFAEAWEIDEDDAREHIAEQSMPDHVIDDDCTACDYAESMQMAAANIALALGFAGVQVEDDTGVAVMIDMTGRQLVEFAG